MAVKVQTDNGITQLAAQLVDGQLIVCDGCDFN
jgi:hypothetical protein